MDARNTIDEQQVRKLVSQLVDLTQALEAVRPDNSTTRQLTYITDGLFAALGMGPRER